MRLLVILLLCIQATAQTLDELENFRSSVDSALGQVIAAQNLFTTENAIASGAFKYSNDLSKLDVFKVPVLYTFGEEADTVRVQLLGSYAHSSYREVIDFGFEKPDFSRIRNTSLTAGVGFEINPNEWLSINPMMRTSYSKVNNFHDYNSPETQVVLEPLLDKLVLNWNATVMTTHPSLGVQLRAPYEWSVKPRFNSLFAYIHSNPTDSSTIFIEQTSSSHYFKNGITLEIPHDNFTGSIFAHRYDIDGDAKKGLGFNYFWEFGAAIDIPIEVSVVDSVELAASYFYEEDLEGFRIGLGVGF